MMQRALGLIVEPGGVVEIRAIWRGGRIDLGYFDDMDKAVGAALKLSVNPEIKGTYLTLNRLSRDVLARAENRIIERVPKGEGTKDKEVEHLRWLLFDCDIERKVKNISATNEEKAASKLAARAIRDYLRMRGWPEPAPADSGNGYHLLYRVDLDNTQDNVEILRCGIIAVADAFDSAQVAIDRGVYNPSRIDKLYGSVVRKGDDTDARPWRLSKLFDDEANDAALIPVSLEYLTALAGDAQEEKKNTSTTSQNGSRSGMEPFDIDGFIARHLAHVAGEPDSYFGGRKWVLSECPFCQNGGGSAFIIQFASGALSFGCLHSHCRHLKWADLREKFEPKSQRHNTGHGGAGHTGAQAATTKVDAPKAAAVAARIEANDHFAQDEGSKLYVYVNGVYRSTGEQHVRARVKKLVPGEQWTNHLANETVEYLRVGSPTLWEQPPLDVICVANGLLDVHKRDLTPFSPKHLSAVQLPVAYDPDATCPAWDKQIEETFPPDAVLSGLAWQTVAWLMTPFTSLQKALLLLGPGGTGKSTFLTALFAFLGRHRNVASMTLQRLENDRFGTSRLVGKLANICADLPSTHLETSSVFKSITGGDPLPAEYKFRDSFDFIPFARLIFSANQPPRSKDATDAFFQRWWVVPFLMVQRGTPRQIPRRELDAALAAPAELSGVLNRALDYLPDVLNHGLTVTESMRKAHEEFQKTTDPLSIWLDKNTIVGPDALVARSEILSNYNADAEREGRSGMTPTAFGSALKQLRHVCDIQRTIAGKRTWCYLGVGLKARKNTQDRKNAPENAA